MDHAESHPGYRIDTEDQARNWMLELIDQVRSARIACDVFLGHAHEVTVTAQRRNFRAFLVRHGSALGSLVALHRCGKLSDAAYNECREIILGTLAPTIVGEIGDLRR